MKIFSTFPTPACAQIFLLKPIKELYWLSNSSCPVFVKKFTLLFFSRDWFLPVYKIDALNLHVLFFFLFLFQNSSPILFPWTVYGLCLVETCYIAGTCQHSPSGEGADVLYFLFFWSMGWQSASSKPANFRSLMFSWFFTFRHEKIFAVKCVTIIYLYITKIHIMFVYIYIYIYIYICVCVCVLSNTSFILA